MPAATEEQAMSDGTHHHGPLAGLGAGAAAALGGCVLLLAAARRQLGEVATVVAWALMVAVVGMVAAAAVYVFLWLRHRVRYPEVLAGRRAVAAQVISEPAEPSIVNQAAVPVQHAQPSAAIEAPRVYFTDGQFAALMRQQQVTVTQLPRDSQD